jgi:hypothetical protein
MREKFTDFEVTVCGACSHHYVSKQRVNSTMPAEPFLTIEVANNVTRNNTGLPTICFTS